MKKSEFLILSMSILLCQSCNDESGGVLTTALLGEECVIDDDCAGDLVCAHKMCMEPDDPCVEMVCPDGGLCRDGGCPDEELCGGVECEDGQVCQKNKCKDLCGDKVCGDDELCRDKTCYPSCGGEICVEDEICLDGICVKTGDCDGLACSEDEVCHEGKCVKKGDCGGIACSDDETCLYDICHRSGDCGGLKCESAEVCHNNKCMPKGDCGEIACEDGQVCDIMKEVCREPGDCNGMDCGEFEYCFDNITCEPKEQCGDVYCEGGYICSEEGTCILGPFCTDGSDRCGEDCCTDSQFCGTKKHCCEKSESCGTDCCSDGYECVNEVCHLTCEEGLFRCAHLDGTETCCDAGQMCVSNQCYAPSVSCVDDYMCENDEYCESTENVCLPKPGTPVCQLKQTGGKVEPTVLWYWGNGELLPEAFPEYNYVMSAPMVADINHDGKIEVVFNSWKGGTYVGGGILRIIDGATGKTLHSSNGTPMTDGGGQVAIGDVIKDNDGLEIVTCICTTGSCHGQTSGQLKIALYNNKAEQIWQSQTGEFNECGQAGPGITDFDGDGQPEIFSRYNVYNGQTGEIIARVPCGDNQYWHQACDYPAAADLDGDGHPELIGGNVAYKVDVANKKLIPLYQRSDQMDGYPAVADLDLDGKPEVVVVRSGNDTLMAFNADGTNHWEAPITHEALIGGPPTVANIDSSPEPEITFAGKTGYIAFNHDGTMKWKNNTHDFSSAKTGSSVFDFDGDGKAEVVYADECFLRVYDGESGKVRFCQYNTNGTHWEYPVIADIDKDEHAEILISANPFSCSIDESTGLDECTKPLIDAGVLSTQIIGLRAFSSPNKDWVNTRKIYNQHAYSITNVSDDGTIPIKVRDNWTITNLNNFRLNVQPGAGYLPDLEIQNISSPRTCDGEFVPIYFDVVNVGWATAVAGIEVHIWASSEENGEYVEVGVVKTDKLLRAAESDALKFDYPQNAVNSEITYIRLTFEGALPTECNLENNSASYTLDCTTVN